jgi:hypothetical protein
VGDIGIGLAASLTKRPLLAIRNASVIFPSARKPTDHARFQSVRQLFQLFFNKLAHTLPRCPPSSPRLSG